MQAETNKKPQPREEERERERERNFRGETSESRLAADSQGISSGDSKAARKHREDRFFSRNYKQSHAAREQSRAGICRGRDALSPIIDPRDRSSDCRSLTSINLFASTRGDGQSKRAIVFLIVPRVKLRIRIDFTRVCRSIRDLSNNFSPTMSDPVYRA